VRVQIFPLRVWREFLAGGKGSCQGRQPVLARPATGRGAERGTGLASCRRTTRPSGPSRGESPVPRRICRGPRCGARACGPRPPARRRGPPQDRPPARPRPRRGPAPVFADATPQRVAGPGETRRLTVVVLFHRHDAAWVRLANTATNPAPSDPSTTRLSPLRLPAPTRRAGPVFAMTRKATPCPVPPGRSARPGPGDDLAGRHRQPGSAFACLETGSKSHLSGDAEGLHQAITLAIAVENNGWLKRRMPREVSSGAIAAQVT